MQTGKLIANFTPKDLHCPLDASSRASRLKVEKVVKPPQKPTAIKAFACKLPSVTDKPAPNDTPSSKHPKELTAKVPQGNPAEQHLTMPLDNK